MADVLEVVIAHVINGEDEAVLVLGDGSADVLEKLVLLLAGLFGDLGHVDHLCALRLGHVGGFCLRIFLYICSMGVRCRLLGGQRRGSV